MFYGPVSMYINWKNFKIILFSWKNEANIALF